MTWSITDYVFLMGLIGMVAAFVLGSCSSCESGYSKGFAEGYNEGFEAGKEVGRVLENERILEET